jgi:beta-lactamase class A
VRYLSYCIILATSLSLSAQSPLDRRLTDICALMGAMPPRLDTVFTSSFLQQVPAFQLYSGVQQLVALAGQCTSIAIRSQEGPTSAKADIVTDKDYRIPVDITIEGQAPYRITGLLLATPQKMMRSWSSLIASLDSLPGVTSCYAINLSTQRAIVDHHADLVLPIGSTFKLYVLGELVRGVNMGTRRWADVVHLDSARRSLPSGVLHTWPHGSPLTLHSLASQMISISDNTATDLLLFTLGRESVEQMQSIMGHTSPERNIPFLSTREMFLLKFTDGSQRARSYVKTSSVAERLDLLHTLSNASTRDVVFADTVSFTGSIEWFASTKDLCAAMSWFRELPDTVIRRQALDVLGINTGVDVNTDHWDVVGYKGGSETGVLNMTYLLRSKRGTWYALSVSWHRTDSDVDLTEFSSLVSQAVSLLEE